MLLLGARCVPASTHSCCRVFKGLYTKQLLPQYQSVITKVLNACRFPFFLYSYLTLLLFPEPLIGACNSVVGDLIDPTDLECSLCMRYDNGHNLTSMLLFQPAVIVFNLAFLQTRSQCPSNASAASVFRVYLCLPDVFLMAPISPVPPVSPDFTTSL